MNTSTCSCRIKASLVLAGLALGAFALFGSASSYASALQAKGGNGAVSITVVNKAGQPAADVPIVFKVSGNFAGRPPGGGVSKPQSAESGTAARLELMQKPKVHSRVRTNDKGVVEVKGLPAGTVNWEAGDPQKTGYADGTIEIKANQTVTLTITLEEPIR